MNKEIYFRFDIDTITCIEKGVPKLLALADKYGVRFTFFANMGQAISRKEVLFKTPATTVGNVKGGYHKISAVKKMGYKDTLRTLLFNPKVGASRLDTIEKIVTAGHELGLHGGHNHSLWQRHAHEYSRYQLESLLLQTHDHFVSRFGPVEGFASPGANGSAVAYELLKELGYRYVSDHMGGETAQPFYESSGLLQIPVNLQDNEVPLTESLRAKGLNDESLIDQVVKRLELSRLNTMVGHPVWEGYRDVVLFEKLLSSLLEQGYEFNTYADLCSRHEQDSA